MRQRGTILYAYDSLLKRCILRHVDVFHIVENGRNTYLADIVRCLPDTRGLTYYAIYHGRLETLQLLVQLGVPFW